MVNDWIRIQQKLFHVHIPSILHCALMGVNVFNGKISPKFDLKSHPSTSEVKNKVKNSLRSQKYYTLEYMIHLHFPLNHHK